jgi:hypothetical protein
MFNDAKDLKSNMRPSSIVPKGMHDFEDIRKFAEELPSSNPSVTENIAI